jgi:hypothetical protein
MNTKAPVKPSTTLSFALSALAVSGLELTSATMAQEAPGLKVVEVLPRPEPTPLKGGRLDLSGRDLLPFHPEEEGRTLLAPAQSTIGPDDNVIVCPSPFYTDNNGLMRRLN